METETIHTLQNSFKELKSNGDYTANYFYSKLYELDPQLAALNTLQYASKKDPKQEFIIFLSIAIGNLHNYTNLVPILDNLGKFIQSKNIKPTFFDMVGTAFIASLANSLKDRFTLEIELAWFNFFTKITETIKLSTN